MAKCFVMPNCTFDPVILRAEQSRIEAEQSRGDEVGRKSRIESVLSLTDRRLFSRRTCLVSVRDPWCWSKKSHRPHDFPHGLLTCNTANLYCPTESQPKVPAAIRPVQDVQPNDEGTPNGHL
jgi:hypothetical protein